MSNQFSDVIDHLRKSDLSSFLGWNKINFPYNDFKVVFARKFGDYMTKGLIKHYVILDHSRDINDKVKKRIEKIGFKESSLSSNCIAIKPYNELSLDLTNQLIDSIHYIESLVPNARVTYFTNKFRKPVIRIAHSSDRVEVNQDYVLMTNGKIPDYLWDQGLWNGQVKKIGQKYDIWDLLNKAQDLKSLRDVLSQYSKNDSYNVSLLKMNGKKVTKGYSTLQTLIKPLSPGKPGKCSKTRELFGKQLKPQVNELFNYLVFINKRCAYGVKKFKFKISDYLFEHKIDSYGFRNSSLNDSNVIIKPKSKLKIDFNNVTETIKSLDRKLLAKHHYYHDKNGGVFLSDQGGVELNKKYIIFNSKKVSSIHYIKRLFNCKELW